MPSRRKRGITIGVLVQKYLIKDFKFLTLNIQLSSILTKEPMGAESISPVARKREPIALFFCKPPGSPFHGDTLYADPLMEPTCRRDEKLKILAVGHS